MYNSLFELYVYIYIKSQCGVHTQQQKQQNVSKHQNNRINSRIGESVGFWFFAPVFIILLFPFNLFCCFVIYFNSPVPCYHSWLTMNFLERINQWKCDWRDLLHGVLFFFNFFFTFFCFYRKFN